MLKTRALEILTGVSQAERRQASAPTNLHVISGEVGGTSENGKALVRIDGLVFSGTNSQYVEVDTLGGLEEGDIATILLTGENGHSMTPMAVGSVGSIDRITVRISAIEADYIKVEQLDAATARIDDLEADHVSVSDLTAATARIGTIEADYLKAADMTAETVRVNNLLAGKASVDDLNAATARIGDLEADHVSVSDFEAEQANIDTLQANTADIATIRANSAKVANLTAAELEADHATVGSLDTNYAQINLANVDNAWIQNGTVKDGAITNAMINSVSANKLTAGTIDASNITVTNLNADNITTGTINGQRIGEGSLSLSKLEDDVYTETEVNNIVDNLQSQIDGAIETWTGTVVPTLQNAPAVNWTTDIVKDTHVGDVYFVVNSQSQQNGYNYRFTKTGNTYSWQLIKDNDVTNALQRLTDAEGRIGTIETFDTTVSSFMTNTDAELTSIKSAATTLEGRVDTAEGTLATKVDTSTFNTLSQTVGENTSSISNLTETVTFTTQRLDNLRAGSTNLLVLSTSLDQRYATSNGKSLVTNNSGNGSSNHSMWIDVEGGADYCLSWYYAPTLPSGYKQYLYALFYDDDATYLGFLPNLASLDISGIDSGTYHIVAPANATKAIICFPKTFLNREDMGFTGYGLKFEKGSVPTDFSLAPYDAEVHPNILRGTNQPDTLSTVFGQGSGGWNKGEWSEQSGNQNSGSVTIIEIEDPPSPEQRYASRIYSSTTGNKDTGQFGGLPFTDVCTLSFWTKVPEESSTDNPDAQIRAWNTNAVKTYNCTLSKETGWTYHKVTWTFTEAQLASNMGLLVGIKGKGTIDYCGLKLEKGFIATPWVPAHEDYAGAHYLENLAIGGRNLLLNTATPFTLSIPYANLPYELSDEFDNFGKADDITLSFWATTEADCWVDFYWQNNSTSYNNVNNFYPAFYLTAGKKYYTVTGQTGLNIANALYLRVRQSDTEHGASAKISDITFTDVKLERGTRASTWSPAPEDVETAITTVSNTVNTVSQTVDSNSAKITNLTTVLGTNADGTTSSTDIIHRTSAIEQDLSGFKTTVSETYSTKTETSNIESRVSIAESSITQNAENIELKVNKNGVISSINQSSESVKIQASKVQIDGTAIFTNEDFREAADAAYASKASEALIESANTNANNALQTALDGAFLVLTSTNGQLFKNGTESTILQVAIFPNGGTRCDTIEQVRSRFGSTAYIEWKWMHESSGEWGTLVSTDSHLSRGGMWLTVSPDDVATKTTFAASLVVPD